MDRYYKQASRIRFLRGQLCKIMNDNTLYVPIVNVPHAMFSTRHAGRLTQNYHCNIMLLFRMEILCYCSQWKYSVIIHHGNITLLSNYND